MIETIFYFNLELYFSRSDQKYLSAILKPISLPFMWAMGMKDPS